jgi:hypothetical protein
LLLDQPSHQIRSIGGVHAVTGTAFEEVGVEQREEKLEVLRLAVMGRRRHHQQMPRELAQFPARSNSFECRRTSHC